MAAFIADFKHFGCKIGNFSLKIGVSLEKQVK
jgi:hypothetical protein